MLSISFRLRLLTYPTAEWPSPKDPNPLSQPRNEPSRRTKRAGNQVHAVPRDLGFVPPPRGRTDRSPLEGTSCSALARAH